MSALGASTGDVLRLVLRQGLGLAALGLLLGLNRSARCQPFAFEPLLFEVKPGDPMIYASVAMLLALVILAASYIPVPRATKLDPLAALRQE